MDCTELNTEAHDAVRDLQDARSAIQRNESRGADPNGLLGISWHTEGDSRRNQQNSVVLDALINAPSDVLRALSRDL
jgi:hypothetical protein